MSLHMLGTNYVGCCIGSEVVASDPESYLGKVAGNGQCVALVKEATGAPATSAWSAGDPVRGNKDITPGTAIATFQDGKYCNKTDGSSHGAIYMSQDSSGIYVIDQWKGQPAHARKIRFQGGKPNVSPASGVASPHNDGDAFSVVSVGSSMLGDALPSDDGDPKVLDKMHASMKTAGFRWDLLGLGLLGALTAFGIFKYYRSPLAADIVSR